jgi:hypothetical protein
MLVLPQSLEAPEPPPPEPAQLLPESPAMISVVLRLVPAGIVLTLAVKVARAGEPGAAAAWQQLQVRAAATMAGLAARAQEAGAADSALPEISFAEFFLPAGDGGLEYAERIRALAGTRVRLAGFMVRETRRHRGFFLLAGRPGSARPGGSCSMEDVPLDVVHVHLPPEWAGMTVPYRPGRWTLTGVLEIGPRPESDQRNSTVRLRLDAAAAALFGEPARTGPVGGAP